MAIATEEQRPTTTEIDQTQSQAPVVVEKKQGMFKKAWFAFWGPKPTKEQAGLINPADNHSTLEGEQRYKGSAGILETSTQRAANEHSGEMVSFRELAKRIGSLLKS